MSYQDKPIDCRDCGGQFIFTAGEQSFFDEKGFINAPTRCPLRRKQLKGYTTNEVVAGACCPYDTSGRGRYPHVTPLPNRGSNRSSTERPYKLRTTPALENIPDDFVEATIVRIDHTGRFVFVNVPSLNQDAYVHASLLVMLPSAPYEQQRVFVRISNSDRGLRATAIKPYES
jgi:cold shock CspA family protein